MDTEEVAHALWSIAYSQGTDEAQQFLKQHKKDFDEPALKKFSEIVWYLVETGDFPAAETLTTITYSLFDDQYIRGRILIFKGTIEFRKENYKKAADIFKKACQYIETKVDSAVAEMNYGLALQRLGDTKKAVTIFKKTYSIFKQEKCNVAAASAIQNLGDVFQGESKHKKAISCYRKAKRIHETEGNSVDTARVEVSMGVSLHNLYQFEKALHLFDHACAVFEREEFFLDIARVHLNKSTLLIALKKLGISFASFYKGLEYLLSVSTVLLPFYPLGYERYLQHFFVFWTDYEDLLCETFGLIPSHVSITKVNDALLVMVSTMRERRFYDLCYQLLELGFIREFWTAIPVFHWTPDP